MPKSDPPSSLIAPATLEAGIEGPIDPRPKRLGLLNSFSISPITLCLLSYGAVLLPGTRSQNSGYCEPDRFLSSSELFAARVAAL
jgi:hypothetical protein